jgi:hypothetical protein
MTLPESSYLSESDLTWFSLSRYDGLADFTHQQWADLILSRLELQRVYRTVPTDAQLEFLTQLQTYPLHDLGCTVQRPASDTPGDTPGSTATVRMLRVGEIVSMEKKFSILHSPADDYADEILYNQEDLVNANMTVHLAVLVNASDKQILSDFQELLANWRKHMGGIKKVDYVNAPSVWAVEQAVPYFDLQLIASMHGKRIKKEVLEKLLFPRVNQFILEKKLRNLPRLVQTIFSEHTAGMMAHLARQ